MPEYEDQEALGTQGARSIQPKFPEISVQNAMDRSGLTGKVSKKTGSTFFRSEGSEFWLNGSRPGYFTKSGHFLFNRKLEDSVLKALNHLNVQ